VHLAGVEEMKPILRIEDDEFMRMRYVTDKYEPVIEYRTIKREKVGTWLFGLLPVYRYFYSDWSEK
jgi:hypothetical protein